MPSIGSHAMPRFVLDFWSPRPRSATRFPACEASARARAGIDPETLINIVTLRFIGDIDVGPPPTNRLDAVSVDRKLSGHVRACRAYWRQDRSAVVASVEPSRPDRAQGRTEASNAAPRCNHRPRGVNSPACPRWRGFMTPPHRTCGHDYLSVARLSFPIRYLPPSVLLCLFSSAPPRGGP